MFDQGPEASLEPIQNKRIQVINSTYPKGREILQCAQIDIIHILGEH
jgi:hypothetical protein